MDQAPGSGRGVFARRTFKEGDLIERAPVIIVPHKQWSKLVSTVLSDYAFDWGEDDEDAAIALGYVSIYNHSYTPNAKLEEVPEDMVMEIVALERIEPGEEITINYNGDPTNRKPLWFKVAAKHRSVKRRAR